MPEKSLALGLVIGASVGAGVGSAFRTVQQQSQQLGQSLKKARLGKALSGDVLKYKRRLEKLKAQQAKTGESSEQLNKKIADTERKFKKATLSAGKHGIEIGDAARKYQIFSRSVSHSEKQMARLERRQRNQQVRSSLKGSALGLIGGAYAIGRQFSGALGFEEASTRLDTVIISNNVGKALVKARKHSVAFARKGLTNETDMLGIQYALSSAGFEAEAARVGSSIVAKVATVTKGAPEQVGEVVATVFNNLGNSLEGNTQQKIERIGDLLAKTQFKFQIRDFGQLGESLKYATPTIAQYSMELAQGVTIMGAMNSAGLQGSQAGTAFAATMRNMSKASQEFGFEMVRNEKGQLDFIATMENLSESIGGFDGMDQETIDDLQKVFGEEGIRGVTLLGKQMGKLRAAQDDVANSSKGVVNKSYEKFVESAPGQLKIFGNNVRLVGMTLAGSLLPALNQALNPLIGITQTVGKAIQQNPELAKTIMAVVAGVFALKAATVVGKFGFTLFTDAGMLLGKVFGMLKGTLGLVATAFRVIGVAMMANPVGLIIGGIALAAGLVVANWDTVKSFFLTIWDDVKPYWQSFATWIGDVWKKISAPFNAVVDFGRSIGSTVADWVNDAGGSSGSSNRKLSRVRNATTAAALSSIIATSPVAANNKSATSVKISAPITVQAAPGMNEERLAELTAEKLNAAARRGSKNNFGYDHDEVD